MKTGIIFVALGIFGMAACSSSGTTAVNEPSGTEINQADTTSLIVTVSTPEPAGKIFEFDSTASGWTGYVYEYKSDRNGNTQITSKSTIKPSLGWQDFEQMAEFYKIFSLPDQDKIKGRSAPEYDNRVAFLFTVKRKGKIRHFSYVNAFNELNDYWQSANAFAFVAYLLDEFEEVKAEN